MKNKNLVWIIIAVVALIIIIAIGWTLLRRSPSSSPIKPAGVVTAEAVVLPPE
jgi:hypothetical protein